MIRHFRTEIYKMFPVDATNFSDPSASLAFVRFGFVSDLEPHIDIFEGNFPEVPAPTSDSTIDVLIARHWQQSWLAGRRKLYDFCS